MYIILTLINKNTEQLTKSYMSSKNHSCKPGKVKNPKTGYCRKIRPCSPGKVKNPKTGYCRKIRPCATGKTRSLLTGRCRKIKSSKIREADRKTPRSQSKSLKDKEPQLPVRKISPIRIISSSPSASILRKRMNKSKSRDIIVIPSSSSSSSRIQSQSKKSRNHGKSQVRSQGIRNSLSLRDAPLPSLSSAPVKRKSPNKVDVKLNSIPSSRIKTSPKLKGQIAPYLLAKKFIQKLKKQTQQNQFLPMSAVARIEQLNLFTRMYKHGSHGEGNELVRVFQSLINIKIMPKNSSSDGVYCFAKSNLKKYLNNDDRNAVIKSHFPSHYKNFEEIVAADPVKNLKILRTLNDYHDYLFNHGINVFIKITTEYTGPSQFRNIEPRLTPIINNMIITKQTPHLMMVLGYFKSDDIFYDLSLSISLTKFKNEGLINLAQDVNHVIRNKPANMLISECGKGKPFASWIKTKHKEGGVKPNMVIPIIFQILFTLMIMQKQITHYDLHFGNIWIQDTDSNSTFQQEYKLHHEKPTFVYLIDETMYVVLHFNSNTGFARVFDWDFAFAPNISTEDEISSKANICQRRGICPSLNPTADMYRFLMILKEYDEIPTSVRKFASDVIQHGKDLFPNSHPYVGMQKCTKQKDFRKEGYCDAFYLCEIEEFEDRRNKKNIYACNGPFKGLKSSNIYDPSHIIKRLIFEFTSDIKYYSLPDFDPSFLPGTSNWENCVFGTPQLRSRYEKELNARHFNIKF